jgi:hypothetical protein
MFQNAVDVANRACQHCGVPRIDSVQGFGEGTERANELQFAYSKLKPAELQRSVWTFATRLAPLRPISNKTMLLAPAVWESGATYFKGSIVSDGEGFLWQSRIPNNTGNQPNSSTGVPGSYTWEPYFGPLTVNSYYTGGTPSSVPSSAPAQLQNAYFAGELVYTAPGNGSYNVYLSLKSGNALDPSLSNQWNQTTTYFQNQVVQQFPAWAVGTTYSKGQSIAYTDGNIYSSLTNSNTGNIPANTINTSWALMPVLSLAWPAISGQLSTSSPSNWACPSSPVIEWNFGTSYSIGSYVMFAGNQYVSLVNANSANPPNAAASAYWVQVTGGVLYMSLFDLNTNNNPASAPALWSSVTTYASGTQVGGSDGQIYTSSTNGNLDNNPVTDGGVHWTATGILNPWTTVFTAGGGNQQWLQIGGANFPAGVALSQIDIVYPLNCGPSEESRSKNIYRLPANFLRVCSQNPKGAVVPFLGGPSGNSYRDWTYNGSYLVTWQCDTIIYRFVADVADVTSFDPMFCEGLGARMGFECCETLTQSTEKIRTIQGAYQKFMAEARTVNAIEAGFEDPPEDEYVSVRY